MARPIGIIFVTLSFFGAVFVLLYFTMGRPEISYQMANYLRSVSTECVDDVVNITDVSTESPSKVSAQGSSDFGDTSYDPTYPPTVNRLNEMQQDVLRTRFRPIPRAARDKYTVIMTTYYRYSLLLPLVKKLSGFKLVHEVIVVWNSINETVPGELRQYATVLTPFVNSINNKFRYPAPYVETAAVMTIDDDANIDEQHAATLFRFWQSTPSSIVGPMKLARGHMVDPQGVYHYLYGSELSRFGYRFSLILTGLSFFHRAQLWRYSKLPEDVLAIVDRRRSCEDVLMNFVVYSAQKGDRTYDSHHALINVGCQFLMPGPKEFAGLSGMTHRSVRSDCLEDFVKHFGDVLHGHRAIRWYAEGLYWHPRWRNETGDTP